MSQEESNRPVESPAETYERYMVPAMFAAWVPDLFKLVELKPGDRVLDVACGTGIVARNAAKVVGESGKVVGVDINPGMLEVAGSRDSSILWQQANATDLPFSDGDFDVVLCQQGLQFVPDRLAVVKEMYRVLAQGGRVAIATWLSLQHSPGHYAIAKGLARHVSGEAAGLMNTAFSLGDTKEIRGWLEEVGFRDIDVRQDTRKAHFPSAGEFARRVAVGSVVGRSGISLSEDMLEALAKDVSDALKPYVDGESLAFPMSASLSSGRK